MRSVDENYNKPLFILKYVQRIIGCFLSSRHGGLGLWGLRISEVGMDDPEVLSFLFFWWY
jgi:hypothetical protein